MPRVSPSAVGSFAAVVLSATIAAAAPWEPSKGPDETTYDAALPLPGGRIATVIPFHGTKTDVLDVATGKWRSVGAMTSVHDGAAFAVLPSGDLFMAGGSDASDAPLAVAEVFSEKSETWAATTPMPTARIDAAAVVVSGVVVVVGGHVASGSLDAVESYDPSAKTWKKLARMPFTLFEASAVVLADGRVFAGDDDTFAIYDATKNTWSATVAAPPKTAGLIKKTRIVALPDGRVLRLTNEAVTEDQVFDPKTGAWTAVPRIDKDSPRGAATLLSSGKVLTAGSLDELTAYSPRAELFDPVTNKWLAVSDMTTSRGAASMVALPDGVAVVTGGRTPAAFSAPMTEIFHPFAPGGACTVDGDCGSAACSDGVCCDRPCTGQCERCDLAASKGVCTSADGDLNHCGAGFICQERTCKPSAGTTCNADLTAQVGKDGIVQGCNAYRCSLATGACYAKCTDSTQCTGGFACADDGTCVAAGAPSGGDSGGCTTSGAGARSATAFALALVLSTVLARGRRRSAGRDASRGGPRR
jgi:hypothetical protein